MLPVLVPRTQPRGPSLGLSKVLGSLGAPCLSVKLDMTTACLGGSSNSQARADVTLELYSWRDMSRGWGTRSSNMYPSKQLIWVYFIRSPENTLWNPFLVVQLHGFGFCAVHVLLLQHMWGSRALFGAGSQPSWWWPCTESMVVTGCLTPSKCCTVSISGYWQLNDSGRLTSRARGQQYSFVAFLLVVRNKGFVGHK